jgi:hypothetical protein
MFIAVLLTSTKINLVAHKWMNGQRKYEIYTYNKISLDPEKNDILPFVARWVEMEDIILSEISQPLKEKF